MSDFVVGKAYSEMSNNVMQELLTMAEKTTPEEMAKIIKERRKSMTIADLKKYISKMPDEAQIKADESLINGVTATIDSEGNIIIVNLEI